MSSPTLTRTRLQDQGDLDFSTFSPGKAVVWDGFEFTGVLLDVHGESGWTRTPGPPTALIQPTVASDRVKIGWHDQTAGASYRVLGISNTQIGPTEVTVNGITGEAAVGFFRSNGTHAARTAVGLDQTIGVLNFYSWGVNGYHDSAKLEVNSEEAPFSTDAASGGYFRFRPVVKGTQGYATALEVHADRLVAPVRLVAGPGNTLDRAAGNQTYDTRVQADFYLREGAPLTPSKFANANLSGSYALNSAVNNPGATWVRAGVQGLAWDEVGNAAEANLVGVFGEGYLRGGAKRVQGAQFYANDQANVGAANEVVGVGVGAFARASSGVVANLTGVYVRSSAEPGKTVTQQYGVDVSTWTGPATVDAYGVRLVREGTAPPTGRQEGIFLTGWGGGYAINADAGKYLQGAALTGSPAGGVFHGVNAPAGFTGNLLQYQKAGADRLIMTEGGRIVAGPGNSLNRTNTLQDYPTWSNADFYYRETVANSPVLDAGSGLTSTYVLSNPVYDVNNYYRFGMQGVAIDEATNLNGSSLLGVGGTANIHGASQEAYGGAFYGSDYASGGGTNVCGVDGGAMAVSGTGAAEWMAGGYFHSYTYGGKVVTNQYGIDVSVATQASTVNAYGANIRRMGATPSGTVNGLYLGGWDAGYAIQATGGKYLQGAAIVGGAVGGTYHGIHAPASFTGDILKYQRSGQDLMCLSNAGELCLTRRTANSANLILDNDPAFGGGSILSFQHHGASKFSLYMWSTGNILNVLDSVNNLTPVRIFQGGTAPTTTGSISLEYPTRVGGGANVPAWGVNGSQFSVLATTLTDTTATGTVASAVASSFGQPTFATQNAGVTYTAASTVYIAGPPVPGGASPPTITNPHALRLGSGNYLQGALLTGAPAGGVFHGLNTPSTFTGNILNYQLNGANRLTLDAAGNLTVAGSVTAGSITATSTTGNVVLPLGAVGAPSLSFVGAPTTGLYAPAAGQAALSIAGADAILVNASRNVTIPGGSLSVSGGTVSCPGGTNSERFGVGSVATATDSVAFGNGATVASPNNQGSAVGRNAVAASNAATALGYNTTAGSSATALGYSCNANALQAVVVGSASTCNTWTAVSIFGASSSATGSGATVVGKASTAAANATAIGITASAPFSSSIALGVGATTTAANQLVIGGTSASQINQVYIGKGVVDAIPTAVTLNATGGSGADIAGASLTFAAGRGTGTGLGGSILLQTAAAAGVTGSSLNALVTRVTIDQAGKIGMGLPASVSNTPAPVAVNNSDGFALGNHYVFDVTRTSGASEQVLFGYIGDGATSTHNLIYSGGSKPLQLQGFAGTQAINFIAGGHWEPNTANAQDLGTAAKPWRTVYSGTSVSAGTSFIAPLGTAALPSHTFTGGLGTGMWAPSTTVLAFSANGVEALRINSAQKVGIGTAGGTYELEVAGTSTEHGVRIASGSTTTQYALTVSDSTGSPNYLVVKGDGSVGIGTASPTAGPGTITTTGAISSPGVGGSSERFGLGSLAAGAVSLAMGNAASASGTNATAIGQAAVASATYSMAIGQGAQATTTQGNLAIGQGAQATGAAGGGQIAIGQGAQTAFTRTIVIGEGSVAAAGESVIIGGTFTSGGGGGQSIIIGYLANAGGFNGVILIGDRPQATAANQFVAGSTLQAMANVYFGKGASNATPTAYTINGTGGLGTDIAGAALQLAGGQGTGTGVGGSILFRYAPAGTTAATLNALVTAVTISGTNGSISCPGAGANSERFGNGSLAAGGSGVAVGFQASATGAQSTAVGYQATAAFQGTAIGHTAVTTGSSIAIGVAAAPGANGAIAIGGSAVTHASGSGIAIGASANGGYQGIALGIAANAVTGAIAIGQDASAPLATQFVVGSATRPMSSVFFGRGVTDAAPTTTTINATGGSGTDIIGGDLVLAGGKPTGSGVGGEISFQTAPAGATGTTARILAERMSIDQLGNVMVGTGAAAGRVLHVYAGVPNVRVQASGVDTSQSFMEFGYTTTGAFTRSGYIGKGSTTAHVQVLADLGNLVLSAPTGIIQTSQQLQTINGTVALAAVSPQGDPNTGIFFPSADQAAVTAGGTRLALWDGVLNTTAIGYNATASQAGNAALGYQAMASAPDCLALGRDATAAHTVSIALGGGATTTATNQFIIGSNSYKYNAFYLGSGVTAGAPGNVVLNATGGSGTNIAGASFTIAGGQGTGTGAGGSILFQTAPAGLTGAANNALATRVTIDANAGWISCPGTGSLTERFGSVSAATGDHSLALGNNTTAAGASSVVVGRLAASAAGAASSIAIGYSAQARGAEQVVIGGSADANTGTYNTLIGNTWSQSGAAGSATLIGGHGMAVNAGECVIIGSGFTSGGGTGGDSSVVLGALANVGGFNSLILMGRRPTATASNQFVAGSSLAPMQQVYFGQGATNAAPAVYTINGTGGAGTDIAGGALQLAGGRGTGTGLGGSILLQTATAAAATGATQNGLTTRVTIDQAGLIGLGVAPAARLQLGGNIATANWGDNGIGIRQDGSVVYTDNASAAGPVTTATTNRLSGGSLAATNAITITRATGLYVAAPTAGTNVAITNRLALYANYDTRVDGNLSVNTGQQAPQAVLDIGALQNLVSVPAWGVNGIGIRQRASTYTDNSSPGGTVAANHVNALATPTLAASSPGVVYTNASTLYIAAAPAAGTNVAITNPHALWVNIGDTVLGGRLAVGNNNPGTGATIETHATTRSLAAWGAIGPVLRVGSYTLTDTSSAGPTTGTAAASSFNAGTLNSTNTVAFTNAATVWIGGPPAGIGNATITNPWALYAASGNIGAAAGRIMSTQGFTMGTTPVTNCALAITQNAGGTAWGLAGVNINVATNTHTDTSTLASTTVAAANSVAIGRPSFGASNTGVVFTDAASFYVANSPAAGANVTITNPWAIWVDAGPCRFDAAVGIGVPTIAALSPAALLQVDSTTQGFLPPRMTGTQRDAIATPPAGLLIYNTTTGKLNLRVAAAWEAVTSA